MSTPEFIYFHFFYCFFTFSAQNLLFPSAAPEKKAFSVLYCTFFFYDLTNGVLKAILNIQYIKHEEIEKSKRKIH